MIKKARDKKQKEEMHLLKKSEQAIEWRILVCNKIADSLAWLLMGEQQHILRRFYIYQNQIKLKNSNIQAMLKFVNEYSKTEPLKFVLISDLTSFMQIGDFIIVDRTNGEYNIVLAEFKEGQTNDDILTFLRSFYKNPSTQALGLFFQQKGIKQYEQLSRVVRQDFRKQNVIEIINKGCGDDASTGLPITISDKYCLLDSYEKDLQKLIKQAETKSWAITVIDECLYIGAYSTKTNI